VLLAIRPGGSGGSPARVGLLGPRRL